jgi:hypothetical protein
MQTNCADAKKMRSGRRKRRRKRRRTNNLREPRSFNMMFDCENDMPY